MTAIDLTDVVASMERDSALIRGQQLPNSYLPPETGFQLLDVCLALHAHNTGASDPIPRARFQQYVSFLARRLGYWKPTVVPAAKPFDDAVKALAEVTWRETLKLDE